MVFFLLTRMIDMKWRLLGYTLWLFAGVSLIGIPVSIFQIVTGKTDPAASRLLAILALSIWQLVFTALLYFLGRFFIRKG